LNVQDIEGLGACPYDRGNVPECFQDSAERLPGIRVVFDD
jgi:hypothetical protein